MIELHDLMSDESIDSVTSPDKSCSTSKIRATSKKSSSNNVVYSSPNIKRLLKEQPEKYTLVNNDKINYAKPSPCWNQFGLPAERDENDRINVIKNYATCRSCYITYRYTYGSTKSLNSHKCPQESSTTSSPSCRYIDDNF